jgi:hypothetical protein
MFPFNLASIQTLLVAIAISLSVGFGSGFGVEHWIHTKAEAQAQLKAVTKVITIERKAAEVSTKAEATQVAAQEKIRTVTKVITKEIPVYVTKQSDSSCTIPNGFVRLHDSSAKSELPPTPSISDGTSSGVTLSEVTETITDNYGTCNGWREQLIGWQNWYTEQKVIYDKP